MGCDESTTHKTVARDCRMKRLGQSGGAGDYLSPRVGGWDLDRNAVPALANAPGYELCGMHAKCAYNTEYSKLPEKQ